MSSRGKEKSNWTCAIFDGYMGRGPTASENRLTLIVDTKHWPRSLGYSHSLVFQFYFILFYFLNFPDAHQSTRSPFSQRVLRMPPGTFLASTFRPNPFSPSALSARKCAQRPTSPYRVISTHVIPRPFPSPLSPVPAYSLTNNCQTISPPPLSFTHLLLSESPFSHLFDRLPADVSRRPMTVLLLLIGPKKPLSPHEAI